MNRTPLAIDPILGVLAPRALASPLSAATLYGVLATTTSIIAAAFEHRLVGNTYVFWGDKQLLVMPLLSNVSTILDFAILNPLVIYFLLRSRQIVLDEPILSGSNTRGDRALHWLAAASCVILSIVLMLAYSHSFLYGKFFDAIVAVSEQGECFVTVTGWVVFFWTGLFTYIVLMGALNQVGYAVRICTLRTADVIYDPLHEDGAAGLRALARPAVEFTKASLVLLIIGLIFWIYDRILTKSLITDRTTSIAIFALIVFPLFAIPIARLHSLMCELRESLLKSILGCDPRTLRHMSFARRRYRRGSQSMRLLADEIEATETLRRTVLSYPTWPMSTRTLVSCGAYFASVATPAFAKLLPLISSALGFAK